MWALNLVVETVMINFCAKEMDHQGINPCSLYNLLDSFFPSGRVSAQQTLCPFSEITKFEASGLDCNLCKIKVRHWLSPEISINFLPTIMAFSLKSVLNLWFQQCKTIISQYLKPNCPTLFGRYYLDSWVFPLWKIISFFRCNFHFLILHHLHRFGQLTNICPSISVLHIVLWVKLDFGTFWSHVGKLLG